MRSRSNPDHTEALLQYGSLLEALGRLDDGLRYKQQALARDPRSPGVLVQIAISYWHQRKYNETQVWARRALEIDPKHLQASQFIMHVYIGGSGTSIDSRPGSSARSARPSRGAFPKREWRR